MGNKSGAVQSHRPPPGLIAVSGSAAYVHRTGLACMNGRFNVFTNIRSFECIYKCSFERLFESLFEYMFERMFECMYECLFIRLFKWIFKRLYKRISKHIFIWVFIYGFIHTYTQMNLWTDVCLNEWMFVCSDIQISAALSHPAFEPLCKLNDGCLEKDFWLPAISQLLHKVSQLCPTFFLMKTQRPRLIVI